VILLEMLFECIGQAIFELIWLGAKALWYFIRDKGIF